MAAEEVAVMAKDVEPRRGGGLRFADGLALVVVGVVGVIVAFWILGAVVGVAWEFVKVIVLVAVVVGVLWLLLGRRR